MRKLLTLLLIIFSVSLSCAQTVVNVQLQASWTIDAVPDHYTLYVYQGNDTTLSPFSAQTLPDDKYKYSTFDGNMYVTGSDTSGVHNLMSFDVVSNGDYVQAALVSFNTDSLNSETAISNWAKTQDMTKYKVIMFKIE